MPVEPPADLVALFHQYLNEVAGDIETQTLSADTPTYYTTSYYLHALLSAVEGTGDSELLDITIQYLDNMIAVAEDINGDGHLEWGPPDVNGRPIQLNHFQGIVPMARAAAIIKSRADLAAYESDAARYVDFVHDSVIAYWHFDVYGEQIPWLPTELGGWGTSTYWSDKCAHFGTIATHLYQATGDALYQDIVTRIATGFRLRLEEHDAAFLWDTDGALLGVDGNNEGVPDTSHANREPMMMAAMHEAGIEYARADLERMAHTLLDFIWNGSTDDPRFSNYINGSNAIYRNADAWANGQIYTGWVLVGGYSQTAQDVGGAVLQALVDGKTNPSLAYMSPGTGRLSLAGHLLRNHARLACP